MLTSPLDRDEKIYESRFVDFLYVTLRDAVFKGRLHYSLIRPGLADTEIMRAVTHERMRKQIESGAGSSGIRSELISKNHDAGEIQDAFIFFNVNMSLQKKEPIREIQRSLLGMGISASDINRAVLLSTFMSLQKDHNKEETIKLLLKKGWRRKEVKRAFLYSFLRNALIEADVEETFDRKMCCRW